MLLECSVTVVIRLSINRTLMYSILLLYMLLDLPNTLDIFYSTVLTMQYFPSTLSLYDLSIIIECRNETRKQVGTWSKVNNLLALIRKSTSHIGKVQINALICL